MGCVIKDIDGSHIDELVASYLIRYKNEREHCKVLTDQIDRDTLHKNIDYLATQYPGVVAIENDKICGCLAGYLWDDFKMAGRGVFCPEITSFAQGSHPLLTFKKLYASMASIWKVEKISCHGIAAFTHDTEFREALSMNELGVLVMDCIRWSEPLGCEVALDYQIRQATADDIDDYQRLCDALTNHIMSPPISLYYARRRNKEELLARLLDPKRHVWLAVHRGKTIGYMQCESDVDGVNQTVIYNKTVGISGAFIDPEHRGKGIAEALLNQILIWAKENDFARCSVDFESTNGYAHGFWTSHFQPVCHSYLRRLDVRSLG